MIRGDFNPNIKLTDRPLGIAEQSECKRSLHYLDSLGLAFYYVSVGCRLVDKVAHLEPLSPLGTQVSKIMEPLGRIAQIAGFIISAEALVSPDSDEAVVGLNLETVKQILSVTGEGVDLAGWVAEIYNLGETYRIVSALPSIGLGIALLSPMVSLTILLREEGLNAFTGVQCYKTSYKLGMALLSVYLFMTAITLSSYIQVLIMGTNVAFTFI